MIGVSNYRAAQRILMKKSFEHVSYLTQVKRLRELATEVVKLYPFQVKTMKFIKFSANAIFKITDIQDKQYILRINPIGHHSQQGILEEIAWIHHIINTTSLVVPTPVKTMDEQYVVEAKHPLISSSRFCMVFEWLPGKKRWKSINEQYACNLGSVSARLQKSGQGLVMKHRHNWLADSLAGTDTARFYNIDQLSEVSLEEQKNITTARRAVHDKLKHYEIVHKDKTGVIHSDLQPNNILVYKGQHAVIDFDDCGVGFYGYDLAGALCAFEHVTEADKSKDFMKLSGALFNGYSKFMPLSEEDMQLIPYFMLASKLMTISWLEARKANSSLRYYFPIAIKRAIHFFQNMDKINF